MAEAQSRLDASRWSARPGAGLVKVTRRQGRGERARVDPSLFVPGEREVVEDLIVAAMQDAQARAMAPPRRRWPRSPTGSTCRRG